MQNLINTVYVQLTNAHVDQQVFFKPKTRTFFYQQIQQINVFKNFYTLDCHESYCNSMITEASVHDGLVTSQALLFLATNWKSRHFRANPTSYTVHTRDPTLRLLERIPKMQNDIAHRVMLQAQR